MLFVLVCGISAQELTETELTETASDLSFDETEPGEEPAEDGIQYSFEELNVATINPMNGNFFSPIWSNITSDIDVRLLLHAYDLVRWDSDDGVFLPDGTVISAIILGTDVLGNETFTIVLYPDLTYSDGTPITAWDYAFSMLLNIAPETAELGAEPMRPEYLLGYDEYISGDVPYLAGFHVIADDMLAITIKHEYLPFFYELGWLSCLPYPISVIAPGVKVADDGRGVYLTNADGSSEPKFTAELLEKTLLDPETGYLSHPGVTSGPYKLVSYEDGKVSLEINENYKGNIDGMVPRIQRLTYEALPGDELVPALESGEIGLLNKMASSDIILSGIQTVSSDNKRLAFANYPRTGLGFINISTERQAMSDVAVRQALAHLMDKDAFLEETIGNFGLRVDGYYGMGQWMYQILTGTLAFPVEEPSEDNDMTDAEYDKQMKEWEELSLDSIPVYEFDPDAAAALLNQAGWNLNSDGTAFRRGVDVVRCKNIDGELVPLELTLAYPEASTVTAGLEDFAAAAADEGIVISLIPVTMEELLPQYYAVGDRTWDMIFLALNFDMMFDPSAEFLLKEDEVPLWTRTGLADQDLYDRTVDMRTTQPGDLLTYVKNWLKYQERMAELEPVIPLYSNVYFDFYARVLQDYNIAANVAWSEAIIPAWLGEVREEEEEELAEDEFGEEEFGDEEFEEFEF